MRRRVAYISLLVLGLSLLSSAHLAAQSKWDSEWVGRISNPNSNCAFGSLQLSANVVDGKFSTKFQATKESRAPDLGKVNSQISGTGELITVGKFPLNLSGRLTYVDISFELKGNFLENEFNGQFISDNIIGMIAFGNVFVCIAEVQLMRKGSLEAEALFTGRSLEYLKLEKQTAALKSKGLIVEAGNKSKIQRHTDFGGKWVGRIVSDTPGICSFPKQIREVVVEGDQAVFRFGSGADKFEDKGDVEEDGKFNDWLSVPANIKGSDDLDEVDVKLAGKFTPKNFEGSFYGEPNYGQRPRGSGEFCEGTLRLGREGSPEEESIKTGRDVEIIAMERLLARVAAGDTGGSNKRAQEKLEKIRAEQKTEAEHLARLKAETRMRERELAALQMQPKADPKSITPASINFGNYHALVIGIDNYQNLKSLKTAVADANAVAGILKANYGFKITKLINPTHEDILDNLDELRETLKFRDNLLIYYAGHGWLDKKVDQGYWLPANAKRNRRSRWVSNATITDALKGIEAKHVMVVADSCYSGRLVRSANVQVEGSDTAEYYQKMSRKKARVVITSGGLEPVEDGKSVHSPFARAFLQALSENNSVIDGAKLYSVIRRPVMVSSDQTPQYSDVRRAGHDGGDFLFVRRNQ